jgi:hypothetical protein
LQILQLLICGARFAMALQRELSFTACSSDQIFHSVPSLIRRVTGYFGISKHPKTESLMFSGIHHNLLNILSLPTFIDVLTDGFHGRRRKVPGGAAGLQKW